MNIVQKLNRIMEEAGKSYWAGRIAGELEYAVRLSASRDGKFDRDIEIALDALLASLKQEGAITDSAAEFSEKLLLPLSEECKKRTMICISHAHIDMNWMWGYNETAGVTADTFRTILDLMYEYPDFTFAQSQASVYRIIEEHAPWLLDKIRLRIREGRWEVTASTWVETDKNMPSGESLTRHILNTKLYLKELLGLDPAGQNLDFEPDTFGHSANVPEICNSGGIKYYYHCRGHADHSIYRWRAPSGAELLVYREPDWYNGEIHPRMAAILPAFCDEYGVDTMLKVYGVGDHGGGPTRRDLDRAVDMMTWPIMPAIKFGTFGEYFDRISSQTSKLPVVTGEQNYIFTGCYTSQSRIKMANRIGEARLFEAEQLGAFSRAVGGEDLSVSMTKAWEGILFNHFHDILPGSGTVETREYAMGLFQKSLASAGVAAGYAMNNIADYIDTSSIETDTAGADRSEGAGVGFGSDQRSRFALPRTERGRGKTRIFTLYNTTPYDRAGAAEITVWDWPGDVSRLRVKRAGGSDTGVQILETGRHYWGHDFHRLAVDAEVPGLGYAVYVVYEAPAGLAPIGITYMGDRRDHISDGPVVLENALVKAVFDRETMRLVSFTEKKTGAELISPAAPACAFKYITESTLHGMTSWRVGPRMKTEDINSEYPVRVEGVLGGLVPSVRYRIGFKASSLDVTIRLPAGSPTLEFDVTADWHEVGRQHDGVPQLAFDLPFAYPANAFANDIPMGIIEREALPHDVPCVSFSAPIHKGSDGLRPSLMLTCDTKYGFRNSKDSVSLTLIRSSFDPDPYPEYGIHSIRIGVAAVKNPVHDELSRLSSCFAHPIAYQSTLSHYGKLPLSQSFARIEGKNIALSAVKTPEGGVPGVIVRVFNTGNGQESAGISFWRKPKEAVLCSADEREELPLTVTGSGVKFELEPGQIATVKAVF